MTVSGGETANTPAASHREQPMSHLKHDPYHSIGIPDEPLMARLCQQIRRSAEAAPFIRGGQALASAIIGSRGTGSLPAWTLDLASALEATLAIVRRRTQAEPSADLRVELATAVIALSVVRADLHETCADAAREWLRDGSHAPHHHHHAHLLAARTLLYLHQDQSERAADAVNVLVSQGGASAGWILHDWVVSRVQQHGISREAQCFHHLRLALGIAEPASSRAALQLLAAVALMSRAGRSLDQTLRWLDEVAHDVAQQGTSSLSAAG